MTFVRTANTCLATTARERFECVALKKARLVRCVDAASVAFGDIPSCTHGLIHLDNLIGSETEVTIPEQVKQLHDRASRGEMLTTAERAELEEWYATQDAAESKDLGLNAAEKTLASLQAQIDAALVQLMTVTKRIQEVASENELLRRENG